jgi:hypothetical protein
MPAVGECVPKFWKHRGTEGTEKRLKQAKFAETDEKPVRYSPNPAAHSSRQS